MYSVHEAWCSAEMCGGSTRTRSGHVTQLQELAAYAVMCSATPWALNCLLQAGVVSICSVYRNPAMRGSVIAELHA